jgi:hypothetical protein
VDAIYRNQYWGMSILIHDLPMMADSAAVLNMVATAATLGSVLLCLAVAKHFT